MSISSTAINVWRLMGVVEAVEVTSSMWRERENGTEAKRSGSDCLGIQLEYDHTFNSLFSKVISMETF